MEPQQAQATNAESSSSQQRRKRGAGVVTANACTECRKKRSKCDGAFPCMRCVSVKAECIYETPVRQSKETMRAEIDSLQTHRRKSERVFTALASSAGVRETLNRIRNGDSLDMIADWLEQHAQQPRGSSSRITTFSSPATNQAFGQTLRMAESVGNLLPASSSDGSEDVSSQMQMLSPWTSGAQSFAHSTPVWGPNSAQGDDSNSMQWQATPSNATEQQQVNISPPLVGVWPNVYPHERVSSRDRGQKEVLGPAYMDVAETQEPATPGSTWTRVTGDIHLVEHLMALYFCWEYPTFASLSKEHFLEDFKAGRPRYCSSLLVNAMLALGCRFSNLPETRADPNDPSTSGDHFFAEAKRLLAEDDRRSLTTIQAIGLISIREASYGHDSESFFYAGQAIRLAVEMGLHKEAEQPSNEGNEGDDGGTNSVKGATFWGAFALDQAWSLNVGRVSHFSRGAQLVSKPSIIDHVESSQWIPYTDAGLPDVNNASQPSNVRSVYKCFCELAELVHQSLYTLYTPGRRLTTSELMSIYTRFLNWYDSLPEALRLGHNFTPAVLFAHMYYHFSLLLLFRPFIKLRFLTSRVSPYEICCQAAENILTLVRSYDQLYTLARTPSFVPYIVLASCVILLVRVKAADGNALGVGSGNSLGSGNGSGKDDGGGGGGSDASPPDAQQGHVPGTGGLGADAQRPAGTGGNGGDYGVRAPFWRGLQDLKAMTVCHGFAKRGLNIVRVFAEQWDCVECLDIPEGAGLAAGGPGGSDDERIDWDSEEVRAYVGPSSKSMNLMCPAVEGVWSGRGSRDSPMDRGGEMSGSGGGSGNGGGGNGGVLFAPFPMQGLPLIEEEEAEMERDGFVRVW